MDRRLFLKSGLAVSATWAAGRLLNGCKSELSDIPKYAGKRLILISLDGGHDSLHAIAPKNNDFLSKLRPTLYADTKNNGIPISVGNNADFVLHRDLKPLLKSLEMNEFRIISNVGVPKLEWNGSHFVSQDFWSIAEYEGNRNPLGSKGTGWIGRLLSHDSMKIENFRRTAIALGNLTPLVLQGKSISGISWPGLDSAISMTDEINKWIDNVPYMVNNSVYQEMADLSKIYGWLEKSSALEGFPTSGLGLQLANAARLIQQDMPFRVIKCSAGGFDTHSGQLERHSNIYPQMAGSLSAFHKFLKESNLLNQTLVVIYSEFGRTIFENSEKGTEHGTAGSMYILGGGKVLSDFTEVPFAFETEKLLDTDNTDYLKYQTDFRDIFKEIQHNWLEVI